MEKKCRFCNEYLEVTFADLGTSPLSNSFLKKSRLTEKEPIFPLHAYVCKNCFLVQLEEFNSPDKIFSDYAYFSSYSETWMKHALEYVEQITDRFELDENSFVIEIASNDGYLLQNFKNKNIPCMGIEPAENIANIAKQKGIQTMVKFFDIDVAKELSAKNQKADLLLGNNVLAHVPNINNFVEGMKILLKPNGIITMEFPHLMQLIDKNQFDTIYHEHFSYISLYTAVKIFEKHNLKIFDVDELNTHGGSLRIYATHIENSNHIINNNVKKLLDKEIEFGITKISTYTNFQKKIEKIKKQLLDFVSSVKNRNKKIVCYGAAAKGNTMLNYCKIGLDYIDYVVDRSPYKQGLYLPGTHILIKSPDEIQKTKPDYVIILPWNLQEEVVKQMDFIKEWGGRFVVPIPEVKIL
ncbi:methyltransferase domain-containing protein [Candidatus Nitrosopumilus sp. SW]|uniref:class I SAM-dependent methyltransferase n=1 Tax=Candidatus Nitrosopumilus sp. SW TaxID=2508726 RepID=UPI0011512FD5|nr:class I SAM-dependent methyltransferase [Candidatus Nitrosopumilus sp. SW]QDI88775.1 methyltransferase domain-containing protein [Candidatus Nitrosopumilus sp. SW]